jgi:hypothetical protein
MVVDLMALQVGSARRATERRNIYRTFLRDSGARRSTTMVLASLLATTLLGAGLFHH